MRAATAISSAVCALLLAGCGSSHGSGTSSNATGKTGSPSASIHVSTTPKFASPSSSAPVRSGVVPIAYRNITIAPDAIRVKAGTTVKWTNYDPIMHNVTSISGPTRFSSNNFGDGGSFEIKLSKPGVIHYECTIHPATMNGTIEVVG